MNPPINRSENRIQSSDKARPSGQEELPDSFLDRLSIPGLSPTAKEIREIVIEEVSRCLPELRERLERDGCSLEGSYCRAACGTLKSMLSEVFGTELQAVQNKLLHTFLMLRIPGRSPSIVVDPTIRQFVGVENQMNVPAIFVGTRRELKAILASCQVDAGIIRNYFRGLSPDNITPVCPELK